MNYDMVIDADNPEQARIKTRKLFMENNAAVWDEMISPDASCTLHGHHALVRSRLVAECKVNPNLLNWVNDLVNSLEGKPTDYDIVEQSILKTCVRDDLLQAAHLETGKVSCNNWVGWVKESVWDAEKSDISQSLFRVNGGGGAPVLLIYNLQIYGNQYLQE